MLSANWNFRCVNERYFYFLFGYCLMVDFEPLDSCLRVVEHCGLCMYIGYWTLELCGVITIFIYWIFAFSYFRNVQEEIQKLAAQIEFMRIVNMEVNNRHIKPKPGGYFTITTVQNTVVKSTQTHSTKTPSQPNSGISEDGQSGSNSVGNNSIG